MTFRQEPESGAGIGEFQDALRDRLMDFLVELGLKPDVDGSGGDSGDWRDLSMDEVDQALDRIQEHIEALKGDA